MANQEQVERLNQGINVWNQWRRKYPAIQPDLSGINLSSTTLYNINFRSANLSSANFISASLIKAYFYSANLSGANFISADLRDTDLRHTNLSGANLSGANLNGASLRGANLSGADLTSIQALGTNFQSVTLTGACIEDWNINSRTRLQEVICEYIFTKYDRKKNQFTERRPHDPSQIFAPGEFTKRYQTVLETVDLFFNHGIDWKAFLASLHELQTQYGNEVNVQGIEKKAGGTFLVRLEVPSEADKAAIESRAKELYQRDLQLLEAQYQTLLEAKDEKLTIYQEWLNSERQRNTDLTRIVETMAEQETIRVTQNFNESVTGVAGHVAGNQNVDVTNSDTFNTNLYGANVGNFANKVQDNARQQTNQHIYTSPEKQSLADAAQEIQKLLKVLEQTNPTATESEQKAFVTAATPPTVRQRAVSAFQSGGKAAIEEFLDNAYVNVAIAIIEGWRDAGQ